MKTILRSAIIVLAITAAVSGATVAYFSDVETSQNNTFTAGTLDLAVDAENPLVSAKFAVSDMMPGMKISEMYRLTNKGSLNGFLDIEAISITQAENGCNEPESAAGDITCGAPGNGEGELQDFIAVKLFLDNGCDEVATSSDTVLYDGALTNMATEYLADASIVAGATQCVTMELTWNTTAQDNKAQGDSLEISMTFELGQTSAQ